MSATTRRISVLAAAAAALLTAFAAAPSAVASPGTAPGAVAPRDGSATVGYAATGTAFTSVSSSWTQPAATCGPGYFSAVFWAGLDGLANSNLEQTGTEVDCENGTATAYGWWEVYPGFRTIFSGAVVHPGDHVSASVTDNNGLITLTLTDTTAGWSRTTSKGVHGALPASAEVIEEVSTTPTAPAPLVGNVTFTNCLANGGAFAKFTLQKFSAPQATVSPLLDQSFTVSWGTWSGSHATRPRPA